MTILPVALASFLFIIIVAYNGYRLYTLSRLQAEKIADLQSQLAILCAGAVGNDERIIRFEQTLSQIKEYQNTLDLGLPNSPGYDHAIRLAKKGVATDQLIDNCNLSDEEAHLINRMHGINQQLNNNDLH